MTCVNFHHGAKRINYATPVYVDKSCEVISIMNFAFFLSLQFIVNFVEKEKEIT